MKNDKVIFFDCYQTLLEVSIDRKKQESNEQKAWENFIALLRQRGIEVPISEFLNFLQKRKADFYGTRENNVHHHDFLKLVEQVLREDFHTEVLLEDLTFLIYEYRKIARGYARVYPKVAETLAGLAQMYALALVSYTQASFTQLELRELEIERYFSYFIYSSDIGLRKTAPGFYEECLRIVGRKAQDCVMVGDNYIEDVEAAQNAGLQTVWVRNPITFTKFEDVPMGGSVPSIALDDFDALPEVIERALNKK